MPREGSHELESNEIVKNREQSFTEGLPLSERDILSAKILAYTHNKPSEGTMTDPGIGVVDDCELKDIKYAKQILKNQKEIKQCKKTCGRHINKSK